MAREFNSLTLDEIKKLRKKPAVVGSKDCSINYDITIADINNAAEYLKKLFNCNIRTSFAAKMVLLNMIYN